MPRFGPVSRGDLIRALRRAGFEGPFSGKRHQFMSAGGITVRIPNPHQSDIGTGLLSAILKEAGISRRKWESL
jgi:predicted RNA binding protein YcfA (HicA-like mRNA interferase family)